MAWGILGLNWYFATALGWYLPLIPEEQANGAFRSTGSMPNTNLYLTVFTSLFCFMCELLCIYKIRLWVTWVIYCEELRSVESEPWVDFWSVLWYFWGTRRKELEMVISFSLCHYWLFNNKTMPFFFPLFLFFPQTFLLSIWRKPQLLPLPGSHQTPPFKVAKFFQPRYLKWNV